jgi:hypothetical protein
MAFPVFLKKIQQYIQGIFIGFKINYFCSAFTAQCFSSGNKILLLPEKFSLAAALKKFAE